MDQELEKKLDSLEVRIKTARIESEDHGTIEKEQTQGTEPSPETIKSARAGSEFIANIIAGGVLGYGIDWVFSTKPAFFMLFLVLGLVSGTYRAQTAIQKKTK
jgi:ATP synthase protein I